MTSHTPGPWHVCQTAPNDSWYPGRTIHARGRRIGDSGFFDPDDIALANATLMAAAPDMQAALKAALPILTRLAEAQRQERDGSMDGPACNTAEYLTYLAVRDAIAKSEGEPQ